MEKQLDPKLGDRGAKALNTGMDFSCNGVSFVVHATCVITQGPQLDVPHWGLMLCSCCLEILSYFLTRASSFSFH